MCNVIEHNGLIWAFKPLDYYQVAPPLFLIPVKILTLIFGNSPYVLRFIPFISTIASIFIFYNLTKKVFNTKHAIIFANFLFAINFLIAYSSLAFKQYGLDLSIFMIILMYASKLDINNLKNINILKYGMLFTVLFFISQPTIFILSGFILYNFIKTFKNLFQYQTNNKIYLKQFKFCLIILIPLISALLYKYSMPENLNNFMNSYWQNGFISLINIKDFIKENLTFLLYESKYLILLMPFMIIGFFIFVFKKTKISRVFLCTLFCIMLASMLQIYPASGRVILYLVPFSIIFITQCFDFRIPNNKVNGIYSCSFVSLIVILMFLYQIHFICKNSRKIPFYKKEPCTLNYILKEYFKNENCILILPSICNNIFKYYSNYLNFDIKKVVRINSFNSEQFYKELLKLNKNNTYWIYLIQDSIEDPVYITVEKWIKFKNSEGKFFYTRMIFGKYSRLYLIRF